MAQNLTEIDYDDVQEIVIPVKYKREKYILREASSGAVARYKNQIYKSTKFSEGKPTQVDGATDAEPLLVSMCIWKLSPAGKELPVATNTVREWGNKFVKELFNRIKDISDLGETEDTEELLQEQIKTLREKLDLLVKKRENPNEVEDETKNSSGATMGISA